MTDADERPMQRPDVEGMTVAEATAAALDADPRLDERRVADVLTSVVSHGESDRLTWSALEGKLDHTAEAVSTARTTVERAEASLEAVFAAAEGERERPVVRSRLGSHIDHLNTVQGEVHELSRVLGGLRAADTDLFGTIYDAAQLDSRAEDLQERGTALDEELQAFETWLSTPDVRFEELGGDLDALADSLDRTTAGVDSIATTVAADDPEEPVAEPALAWVDATFTHRVLELLLSDLEWEFDALRGWSDDAGDDVADRVAELATRLAAFDDRIAALGERLDDIERASWTERFDEERAAFEADVGDTEPPVDWAEIQETLETHRQRLVRE